MIKSGDTVTHCKFGVGVVSTEEDGEFLVVFHATNDALHGGGIKLYKRCWWCGPEDLTLVKLESNQAYAKNIFNIGDKVRKISGDYHIRGEIRAVFTNRKGLIRYVVEHYAGMLHIYSANNLELIT